MKKEVWNKLNGIWIISLCYLAWCFLTISYQHSGYLLLSLGCTGTAILLFVITIHRNLNGLQLFPYLAAVFLLVGIGQTLHIGSLTDAILVIILGAWTITFIILYLKQGKQELPISIKVFGCISNQKWLIVLLILQLFLAYDSNLYQFKWDGLLYYRTCQNLSLTSISNLAIYGHIAQTYGFIVAVASLFIEDVGIAMIVMNMLLLTISTVFFYRLVKLILPEKKEIIYILATAIFAFSPYYLGMVGYHNLDFYLQCLFPVVLYYTLAKKWVQQVIAACLFCFTKEPAIIIYAGLCFGIVLVDLFGNCEVKFGKRFRRILGTVHYYYMLIPGVLWFVTYRILGPWSAGDSSSGFNILYILNKLKVLYCLQFNWLFSLILVFGIALLCTKHRMNAQLYWLIPVLSAQFFFTVFSCFLQTVNHPRYSDSTMLTLYLISAVVILELNTINTSKIICVALAILLLISNYRTCDPISKYIFANTDIGETDIITTEKSIPLGDGAIYNKQSLWAEKVMNQAIDDTLREDTLIVIPAIGGGTYSFDGMSEVSGLTNGYCEQKQYWNEKEAKRVVFPSEGVIQYNLYFVENTNTVLGSLHRKKGQFISFLYYDDLGTEYLNTFLDDCNIIRKEDYHYGGWVLHRAVLSMD